MKLDFYMDLIISDLCTKKIGTNIIVDYLPTVEICDNVEKELQKHGFKSVRISGDDDRSRIKLIVFI